ncbi:unnamed protein product [Adineta ricciae]|uniref:Uncharacterized protein n=1 Tax=Adineta ricciae TaxID=249248 RepID=A0A815V061_ADIRI|nr:unnamed protein product [Adineta ricciae]
MINDKPTGLLSLPNELLLYHIFIYLHSTDLLHAFGQLYNRRLNALLCAYIRHVDFSTIDTSVVSIDRWLPYLTISSFRINADHLNDQHFAIFSSLNRLDLQLTTASQKVSQMVAFTRLKVLSITLTSEQPQRLEGLASFLWHPDNYLESLSSSNCFILDKDDLFPTSSSHLFRHCFDAVCTYALEHFELRLHNVYNRSSTFSPQFLQRRAWPAKVRSLRFVTHDQLMDTTSFCAFVKRFSLSLEHLSFYISTRQRFLMSTPHSLEQDLLTHLTHLKRIDFCVHSGFMNVEIDRRQTFDNWTKKQVISILHRRQFHTRFTLPFAFDRLEHVRNGFVDFHCNYRKSNAILSLPSVVMISLDSRAKFSLVLFTFIQQICPCLRHLQFKNYCHFSDDLIQNTTLTLPTVIELCLGNVICSIDFPTLHRVLCLIPNLKHLTAKRCHINVIDTMNNDTTNVTLPPDNFDHFVSLIKLNLIGFNTQRKTFEGGNKEEQDDDNPNDFVFDFLILTPSSALFYSHSFSRYVLVYVIFNLFKNYCHFSDDLIQNTTLTLPTVNELCLGNVVCSIDFPTLRRVLCLIPNLKHLTAKRCHINVIDTMNNDTNAACSMIDALCQMDPQAIPKRIYLLGGYYNINYMQLRNQIDVMHENSKSVLKANVTLPPDNFDHFVSLVKLNLIGFNTQRKTFEGGNKEEQDDDNPND